MLGIVHIFEGGSIEREGLKEKLRYITCMKWGEG